MRGFGFIVAAAALATLGGCNLLPVGGSSQDEPGASNSVSKNTTEGETKADDRPARERPADEPSRNETTRTEEPDRSVSSDGEWILGRWGDAGCQTVIEFRSGGAFTLNGSTGQWFMEGDTLTMSGGGGEQVYTLVRESGGFNLTDAEGNSQQLGRC